MAVVVVVVMLIVVVVVMLIVVVVEAPRQGVRRQAAKTGGGKGDNVQVTTAGHGVYPRLRKKQNCGMKLLMNVRLLSVRRLYPQ